jgi:hypothetical protein
MSVSYRLARRFTDIRTDVETIGRIRFPQSLDDVANELETRRELSGA